MKKIFSPSLLLFGLVLTIYIARQSDFSLSRSFGQSLRRLANENRPSEKLCKGVNLNEPVSASDKKKAQDFSKSVDGLRGGNPLMDFVNEDKDKDDLGSDYVVGLIPTIAPWIAFFFITGITCTTICCNWCCMYGLCKNCKACTCCKEPKKTSKKKIFAGFTGVFLICTLGASITGLTFSSGVSNGMELTLCSFLNVLENLAYGNPTDKWIGVTGTITQLDSVLSQLSTAMSNVQNFDSLINDYDTQYIPTSNAIKALYTNQSPKNVKSAANLANYKPNYIANLGPETTETTFSGLMFKEVNEKKTLVDTSIKEISDSSTSLKSGNLQSELQDGRDSASKISKKISDVLDSIGDDGKTAKDVINIIGNALTGVFAANTALSIFAFTSMVMVGILKIKFFNKLLHLSWCLITILTLLGFLLAIFTYPVSVVMMEGCEVLDTALNDEAFFTKVMNNFFDDNKDFRDTLHECIYGDGNMLKKFDIENQMNDFDTIFTKLDEVNAIHPLSAGAPASLAIPVNEDIGLKTLSGIYIDSDNTANALTSLNQKVNTNYAACTLVLDTWVLHSDNCTSAMGTKFTSANNAGDNYKSATCIGFNEWGSKDINIRYQSADFGCSGSALTDAKTSVTNFQTNRGEINTVFSSVNGDIGTIKTQNNLLDGKMTPIFTQLNNLKTGLSQIQASLKGEESGIIPNTNCKFIANDLKRLTDSVCYSFISSLYQTSLAIIITAFFSLFSTIAVFCLAKRFLIEASNNAKSVSPK